MRTKRISNPTRFYQEGVTKTYLNVPDYHCTDAIIRRRNDMGLRIAEEIKRYNSTGGRVLFVTTTYRDEDLPMFRKVINGELYEFPCFNRSHQQKFVHAISDRLRKLCGYKGNKSRQDIQEGLPFRYTCACEYGDGDEYQDIHGNFRTGTYRPHLHWLLYFPSEVVKFFPCFTDWMDMIQDKWPYGFCRWSHDKYGFLKLFAENEFAGLYVSKYCTKDMDFYDNPKIIRYLYPDGLVDCNGKPNKPDHDRLVLIKKEKPFFANSQHLGESLKFKYNTIEDFRDGVNFDLDSEYRNGKVVKHKAPRYIIRKTLEYYDRQEGRYKNTEIGKIYKAVIKRDKLLKEADAFMEQYSTVGLRRLVDNEQVQQVLSQYNGVGHNIDSIQSLSDRIFELLGGRSPLEFLLFRDIWCGVEVPMEVRYTEDSRISSLSLDELFEESIQLYSAQLDSDYLEENILSGSINYRHMFLYDRLHRFRSFTVLNQLIQAIHDVYRCNRNYHYERKRMFKKNGKSKYYKTA